MLGLNVKLLKNQSLAFFLQPNGYSIAAVADNHQLLLAEHRELGDSVPALFTQKLAEDVARLKLTGRKCHVILSPEHYQLLLMDAVDVPPEDMAKALRWRLKGLVDYPLQDIALDAFPIPPHGVAGSRKKVFVAVTLLSELNKRLSSFEAAFLEVVDVGIAELALRNLIAQAAPPSNAPEIVIGLNKTRCQLQIYYLNNLYLVRELPINAQKAIEEDSVIDNIILEIQRSQDYCLSELKLAEPQRVIFTPGFYQSERLLQKISQALNKDCLLMNLNAFLDVDFPYELNEQQNTLYSVGGGLTLVDAEPDRQNLNESIN